MTIKFSGRKGFSIVYRKIENFCGKREREKKGKERKEKYDFVGYISHLFRTRQNRESKDTFEKSSSILSIKRS